MPVTKRQRRAAQVAYGIKKRGGTPRAFSGMSMKKLHKWASSKKLDKKSVRGR